ncbi:MAG TPA: hypothetical protein VLT91_04120 [Rhizomicrobium sp.]|nr:hypothetical protein [Rhizomicrobium sp.]
MSSRKKPAPTPIRVDGHELLWTLLRDTQWSSRDDYQGITISVVQAGPARRELLLKYPFLGAKPNGHWHIPEKLKVTPQIVEAGVREALEAGWDPDSRGKVFTWFVEKAQ